MPASQIQHLLKFRKARQLRKNACNLPARPSHDPGGAGDDRERDRNTVCLHENLSSSVNPTKSAPDWSGAKNFSPAEARKALRKALVIGAVIAVHREPGPGPLERVYEVVPACELGERGLRVECQVPVVITYTYPLAPLAVEPTVPACFKCFTQSAPVGNRTGASAGSGLLLVV
jgi:hypothetical protein